MNIHKNAILHSYTYPYKYFPYIVFWYKNKYRDWPECIELGANMNSLQHTLPRAWNISTKYGYTYFPHFTFYSISKKKDFKKEILHIIKIRKRKKRHLISAIVTRKIGVLGFYIASFI